MMWWESVLLVVIWLVLFIGYALIESHIAKKKQQRCLERNMQEHRLRRNRHNIIANIERGEW